MGSLPAQPQNVQEFHAEITHAEDRMLHGAAGTSRQLNQYQKLISWPPDRTESPPPLHG